MDSEASAADRAAKGRDLLDVGTSVAGEIETILKAGRTKRLKLKLAGRTIKEVPLRVTAVGALVVALAAVVLTQLSLELEGD
ncbi:MAG TPA: DUF4342 domain-containing protein [Armatimonadota bacterium]